MEFRITLYIRCNYLSIPRLKLIGVSERGPEEYGFDACCIYKRRVRPATASQITSFTIVYSTAYSRRRSKKTSKFRVTDLCEENSPVTGEFPSQRASNTETVSI